jgi:hypothetical protein
MKRVVVWERVDTKGLEYAEIELDPLRISGELVLVAGGASFAVSYTVDCDLEGRIARAALRLRYQGRRVERVLIRTAAGRWTIDGAPVPELDGLEDVDLSTTPSTNTLPVRRLDLPADRAVTVTAAWVRFPALDVVPLRQTYRRVGPGSFAYAAPDLDFEAVLECDEDGIVRSYGGLWRRVE